MSIECLSNRKVLFVAAGILLIGAGVGVSALSRHHAKTALPKDLSTAIKADSSDPAKLMHDVRQAMNRTDLTEQQRHEVWQNARGAMEMQMDKRIDEYFAAKAESDRQAILDRQIDEMQARMKEWQQRQQQEQASRPAGASGGQAQAGGAGGRGAPSRQERKERSESRNPDKTAKRMAYFTAMHARADQRGIEMPFGGGPGGRRGS